MTALQKISSSNKSSHYRGTKIQESGSNLFIENPFSGDRLTKYFSTHPPLEKRIDNIKSTKV
jgi:heat shock protein HtpX